MSCFCSDNTTDLKVRCDYCIKFQVFEGAQDVFSRLTVVCCTLVPNNPYRVLKHYKNMLVGPSVAVNIDFCGISDF